MKETKRIVKVGANVGSFFAKVATKNLLGFSSNDKSAKELFEILGGLKGPIMKVAQILSMIPDAIPKEYAEYLSKLQAEAPSMGWLFVKRRMQTELGYEWINNFSEFEKKATKAASLGQVHKSILKKNKKVLACKLQYPDMESAINADLKQLKLIIGLYRRLDNTINTKEIFEELRERLIEEVDYINEYKNILIYKKIFDKHKNIKVPYPYSDLSTKKLITMTWLEGKSLSNFYKASLKIRNNIASNLFIAWYMPFYKFGIIHGDPHPGNYTVNKDGKILNLLDFGSVRVFNPNFIEAVINLYQALKFKNNSLAAEAYKGWGFKDLNHNLINALNVWAEYLYAPLLDNKVRKIQDHEASKFGKELLTKVRKEIKKYGGIRPPREFVLVDRAAVGLGSVFMHLKAELNWHQIYENMIKNFNKKSLLSRQTNLLKNI